MAIDLLKQIFATSAEFNSRLAIVTPTGSVSYGELTKRVVDFAGRLSERGVEKGSSVNLSVIDDIDAVTTILACALIGCRWTVQLNRHLDEYGPFFLVHDENVVNPDQNNLIYVKNWSKTQKKFPLDTVDRYSGFESANDTFYLATSSGTTGNPKLIEISAGRALESMLAHAYIFKDKNLNVIGTGFPITSFAGINVLLGALQLGVTFLILPIHKLSEIRAPYEFLKRQNVDLFVCSPDQLNTICEGEQADTNKLRFALLSGAPLSGPLINRALDYFSIIFNYYGSTETGRVSLKPYMEKSFAAVSVGTPFQGTSVEIVDEIHIPLPVRQEGMVRIKSPLMAKRYFADPETTKAVFLDEWFYPGDMGMIDENGELLITGRSTEIINIGGTKLNPQKIDDLLLSIEGIADSVAFSIEESTLVPKLGAILVLRPNVTIEEIIRNIFSNLKKFSHLEIPRSIFILDKAPRNENGKAMRRKANEAVSNIKGINLYDILVDIVAQKKVKI